MGATTGPNRIARTFDVPRILLGQTCSTVC